MGATVSDTDTLKLTVRKYCSLFWELADQSSICELLGGKKTNMLSIIKPHPKTQTKKKSHNS